MAGARRATMLIGLAAVAIVTAGAAYLGPGLVRHSAQSPAPPPTQAPRWRLLSASFGDADHGAVTMARMATAGGGNFVVVGPPSPLGTYLTSDGGRTWTPHRSGVFSTTFLDGSHAVMLDLGPPGSFETTAGAGRTWTNEDRPAWSSAAGIGPVPVGAGPGGFSGPVFLDADNIWWLAAGPGILSGPVALWRSSDGGRTWTQLAATGIPNSLVVAVPAFVDRLRGAMGVASTPDGWPSLLTTRDGGETWQPAALPEPPLAGAHLAVSGPRAATLLAHAGRLVLSVDLLPAGIVAPSIGPPGGGPGSPLGRWSSVSEDGGQTWAPWAIEPATSSVSVAVPIFDDTGRLLLAADRQLWASGDDGRTWRGRSLPLPPGVHASGLLAARTGGLVLLAWRGAGTPGDLVLVRSRDGGAHWNLVPLPGT